VRYWIKDRRTSFTLETDGHISWRSLGSTFVHDTLITISIVVERVLCTANEFASVLSCIRAARYRFIEPRFHSLLPRYIVATERFKGIRIQAVIFGVSENSSGAVLRRTGGPRSPIQNQKSDPLWPPNEVHQADILTEVYVIASLGLQVQVCQ